MDINIYNKNQQGQSNFGALVAQKPLNFPNQPAAINRIGSLFYWSWSNVESEFSFDFHPHEGFHIMTYILDGKVIHEDSAGNKGELLPGDAQVIHAGSGIFHKETIYGPGAEAFQIWFEPYLNEAIKQEPFYQSYRSDEFSVTGDEAILLKQVAGNNGGVKLGVDANVTDVTINAGEEMVMAGVVGRSIALVVIEGNGTISKQDISKRDFVTINADKDNEYLKIQAHEQLRIFMIEMPTNVGYQLYEK